MHEHANPQARHYRTAKTGGGDKVLIDTFRTAHAQNFKIALGAALGVCLMVLSARGANASRLCSGSLRRIYRSQKIVLLIVNTMCPRQ